MCRLRRALLSSLFAIPLLLAAQSASAIVTVGPAGGGCTYTSINAAINYVLGKERDHPDDVDPYIALAGGYVYNEPVVIDSTGVTSYTNPYGRQAAFVQIYGNYDGNCDDIPDGSTAYIGTGGGKVNHSVLEIKGSSAVDVVLNHLVLADAYGSVANGGGINFHGSGVLDLSNVEIKGNTANYGGGIYANGQAPGISITLHSGTLIHDNLANHAGGGIRIEGETHLYALEDQSIINYNTANPGDTGDGTGGGIQVLGSEAVADIGSPGLGGFVAVIYANHARLGGGIAVQHGGTLRMFSATDSAHPARVEYNLATLGGGIYVEGGHFGGAFGDSVNGSAVCGYGSGINFNTAVNGAAIYVDVGEHNYGGLAILTRAELLDGHCGTGATLPAVAPCSLGQACNSIRGNDVTQDDGAVVLIQNEGSLEADQITLSGNTGGSALQIFGGSGGEGLRNCTIVQNILRHELVRTDEGGILGLYNCTLAGNALGAQSPVFSMSGLLDLRQSIVWQPQATVVSNSLAVSAIVDVIASDADSLVPTNFRAFSNVHSFDPAFLDPANGDFQLKPNSLAIDYASASLLADDQYGYHRPTSLLPYASSTPYDIGAYERQNLGDLIFANGVDRVYH